MVFQILQEDKTMTKTSKVLPIIQWMKNNSGFDNQQLYEAFPDKSPANLRVIKSKFTKGEYKIDEAESSNSRKVENTSINTCTDASTQNDEPEKAFQSDESRRLENACINESTDTSTFSNKCDSPEVIHSLGCKHDAGKVQAVIDELVDNWPAVQSLWMQPAAPPQQQKQDYKPEPPFKQMTISMEVGLSNRFAAACKDRGVSQRRVIHSLMAGFIERESSDGLSLPELKSKHDV